jgi:hypothetical protein
MTPPCRPISPTMTLVAPMPLLPMTRRTPSPVDHDGGGGIDNRRRCYHDRRWGVNHGWWRVVNDRRRRDHCRRSGHYRGRLEQAAQQQAAEGDRGNADARTRPAVSNGVGITRHRRRRQCAEQEASDQDDSQELAHDIHLHDFCNSRHPNYSVVGAFDSPWNLTNRLSIPSGRMPSSTMALQRRPRKCFTFCQSNCDASVAATKRIGAWLNSHTNLRRSNGKDSWTQTQRISFGFV